MPLASSGLRALSKGAQAHFFPSGGGTQAAARAIHIPAFAPRSAASQVTSTAQTVLKQTRTILSRFVAHLTTPGTLRAPADVVAGASRARAFHGPATRMPSIHERMSYPARCFLSRPPQVPFLPRAPGVPRNITQVGLGTARNFSTGRPVFQHLAENVPIYARAFSEADWKMRMQEERERMKLEKAKAKANAKEARKAKAPLRPLKPAKAASTKASEPEEELERYFPEPAAPEIIASMHASHGTHALRVSSLFARLDASRVFEDPRIHCEARGDPAGLCTVLEVRFEGWTANRVRGVIGEAGTGWCVLEEVWRDQDRAESEDMDAALDTLSASSDEGALYARTPPCAGLSDMNGSWGSPSSIDPARSFVLPTLDFSASVAAPAWSPPASLNPSGLSTPLSDLEPCNEWSDVEDALSPAGSHDYDLSSDSESVSAWYEPSQEPTRSEESWFGFSSQFTERMRDVDGPREQLF
ncbi:hypothetical protein BV20DRAFT_1104006 [Pilatotrama ljubarskyi]|nr:hypothetical protein BV20DRAFT_1104006 [Pilatotrama ljubarskyi]